MLNILYVSSDFCHNFLVSWAYHQKRRGQMMTSRISSLPGPCATGSFGRRPIGSERSSFTRGSVRGAGVNSQAKDFVNSRSITGTTTTKTIRLTAVTGSCYASTVMTMSTRGIWMRNSIMRRRLVASKSRLLHTGRSLVSKPC